MAFNGVNPVSIGDPTRKTDYDRAFDNTLGLQDGTAVLDAVDIVTGAATAWGFHMGEAANEGGWFTSTADTLFEISAGAEYTGGGWVERHTESGLIRMSAGEFYFYWDSGRTPGDAWTPTLRLYSGTGAWNQYGHFLQADEISDPSAPSANNALMYARDNGGKTELVARFPTGAIQQIAIQP